MRARSAVAAGLAAAALLASLLAPASADDLTDKADHVHDKIAATEDALEGASDRLQEAWRDLAPSAVAAAGGHAHAYDAGE